MSFTKQADELVQKKFSEITDEEMKKMVDELYRIHGKAQVEKWITEIFKTSSEGQKSSLWEATIIPPKPVPPDEIFKDIIKK